MINKFLNFLSSFFKRGSKLGIFFNYKIRIFDKNQIFFFHLNRSGGNSLKIAFDMISKENKTMPILRLSHKIKTKDINFSKNNRYIFSFRDPISRFNSVFYTRKFFAGEYINELEKKFYNSHKDINSLCENLYDINPKVYELKNIDILKKIDSLSERLENWFDIEFLMKRKPFFIFEFEKLQNDFDEFCKKINFNEKIDLNKLYKLHKAGLDYSKLTKFSEKSKKNLEIFLKLDYEIYNYLIKNKKIINSF